MKKMWLLCSLLLSSCTLKAPLSQEIEQKNQFFSFEAQREKFLNKYDFLEALKTIPSLYRFQVASQQEWTDLFERFREAGPESYTTWLNKMGEKDFFWAIDHGVIPLHRVHTAFFTDISLYQVKDIKGLTHLFSINQLNKLHQLNILKASELNFFFKAFIQAHPKDDLIAWKQHFDWNFIKHLYFLKAFDKQDLKKAFNDSRKQYGLNSLKQILTRYTFEELQFLHQENIVSSAELQRAFVRIQPITFHDSFVAWAREYGPESLAYLIKNRVILSHQSEHALKKDLTKGCSFQTLITTLTPPLIQMLRLENILTKDELKELWTQQIAELTYPQVVLFFRDYLDEYAVAWLEKEGLLGKTFWQDNHMPQKIHQSFQDFDFVVLRDQLFPLPLYFQKNKNNFPPLAELISLEQEYQSHLQRYQSESAFVEGQYKIDHEKLVLKQENELKDLSAQEELNELSYKFKKQKEEIISRYNYLTQRLEIDKNNKMANIEKRFEDEIYNLTQKWQAL